MAKASQIVFVLGFLAAATYCYAQPVTDPAFLTRVPGSEQGYVIFQERCMACHGNENFEKAPSPEVLGALSVERIYQALTDGVMQVHVKDLSDADIRKVAESISGQRLLDLPEEFQESGFCSEPSVFNVAGEAWHGWGNNSSNTRFQSKTKLTKKNIPDLKLRWAFGFAQGVSAFSQPSVVGGRIYVGSDVGRVYSLDAKSGCINWSFAAQASVRSTVSIGPIIVEGSPDKKYAAFFADMKANLYAVDVETGELIWRKHIDDHLTARVTASPVLHDSVLYVPMSSWEEAAARSRSYPCCTFQGSMSAYDANTGEQIWKTYTIQKKPSPQQKNSQNVQLYTPAGASVWNTPVIDPIASAIYFGTGNSFTYPAPITADSVLALDLKTGKRLWSYQVYQDDAFLVGCKALPTENCPKELGPDKDITTSVILKTIGDNERVLIVATRPGEILSLNPDAMGRLNWRVDASQVKGRGMIWGGAADDKKAYFGLTSGGMVAVSLSDGSREFYSPISESGGNHGSPVTAIEEVLFVGGIDGHVNAVSADSGATIWRFNTMKSFETANEVTARGGSIMAAGPVVVDDLLLVSSGYQVIYGAAGNVLLAFALND